MRVVQLRGAVHGLGRVHVGEADAGVVIGHEQHPPRAPGAASHLARPSPGHHLFKFSCDPGR